MRFYIIHSLPRKQGICCMLDHSPPHTDQGRLQRTDPPPPTLSPIRWLFHDPSNFGVQSCHTWLTRHGSVHESFLKEFLVHWQYTGKGQSVLAVKRSTDQKSSSLLEERRLKSPPSIHKLHPDWCPPIGVQSFHEKGLTWAQGMFNCACHIAHCQFVFVVLCKGAFTAGKCNC